ncbi:na+ dependent nucleoside transporter family protein, partial [Vibrio parahaemolyticus IDH02640]
LVSSSLFASFLSSFSSALLSLPFTTWASCKK